MPGAFAGQKDPLPVWPDQVKFLYEQSPASGNWVDPVSPLPGRPDEVRFFQEDGPGGGNWVDPISPFPVHPDEVTFSHKHRRTAGNGGDPIGPTPEPMTLVLFGTGLVVLGGALRRRNRKRSSGMALPGSDLPAESGSPVVGSSKC